MHKTLRGSSFTEDQGETSSNPHSYTEQSNTLRLKARRVSRSLRIKLKGLFSGAKSEDGAGLIPCQHIEAQRTHVTPIRTSDTDAKSTMDEDDGLIHSTPARVSTLRVVPSGLAHSSKASMESLKSERDRKVSEGSSLTSWAHSGPSTLTSQEQQQWREWEKQRLSVIRENGAHAPSPSIRRRVLGSGMFQPPAHAAESPVAAGPMVDSQRIYSALVKRMKTTDSQTAQNAGLERPASAGEDAEEHSNETPDTIKPVIPDRKYPAASRDIHTPTRCSKRASLSRKSGSWDQEVERPASAATEVASIHKGLQGEPEVDSNDIFTQGNARPDWHSSVAGSPASHLFRKGSPYRRALRRSMQEEQNAWAQQCSVFDQDSDTGTQVHHGSDGGNVPETDSDSAKDLAYSESVYSSDEGDRGSKGGSGNSAANTPAMYCPGAHRETSAASSVDWKTWLSANVDKLEPTPSPTRPSSHAEYALPTMSQKFHAITANRFPSLRGHVREQAQIDDDDDTDAVSDSTPTQKPAREITSSSSPSPFTTLTTAPTSTATPLGQVPVQPNIITNRSPLRHAISVSKHLTPPTFSIYHSHGHGSEPGNNNNNTTNTNRFRIENESPTRAPPPPPIPPRSKMRPEPLRIVRGSLGSQGQGQGHI
ncbi:uncharacterized protein B0H64DRAFT_385060 [Chaetomium fimeti]|uniref:Uncharacterized protein n=1 Tax=Chaetomium fimeti TaxID=1854472 RepID=A0AAE0HKU1_9PEZI|nr:hypothetical protein B0H64DRAFT_385060 [Chaetomium fimeti]